MHRVRRRPGRGAGSPRHRTPLWLDEGLVGAVQYQVIHEPAFIVGEIESGSNQELLGRVLIVRSGEEVRIVDVLGGHAENEDFRVADRCQPERGAGDRPVESSQGGGRGTLLDDDRIAGLEEKIRRGRAALDECVVVEEVFDLAPAYHAGCGMPLFLAKGLSWRRWRLLSRAYCVGAARLPNATRRLRSRSPLDCAFR